MAHTRINAPELARGHFGEAKRRTHMGNYRRYSSRRSGARGVHLAAMRNAWVAHHAGAPWMQGCSVGLAEAHVRTEARLRTEVERLRGERDFLQKQVRLACPDDASKERLREALRREEELKLRHHMDCRICDESFDMRSLDQVVAHEHHGPRVATGIKGDALTREAGTNP